jgi:hypothetical protein
VVLGARSEVVRVTDVLVPVASFGLAFCLTGVVFCLVAGRLLFAPAAWRSRFITAAATCSVFALVPLVVLLAATP